MKLEWNTHGHDGLSTVGFAISAAVSALANEHMSEVADMFPLQRTWTSNALTSGNWFAIRLIHHIEGGRATTVLKFEDSDADYLRRRVEPFEPRSHAELVSLLGSEWFSFSTFTYVGPYNAPLASWPDLHSHLVAWLNDSVLPEVLTRNRRRVMLALPEPPTFDVESIRRSWWVLECEESCRQGTAFSLVDTGLVTCHHVLGPNTVAFRPSAPSDRFPVEVVSQNSDIDLAVLSIDADLEDGLELGSADSLEEMANLMIAGFPNYRLGDTGVFVPGSVVGFRPVSGIRRILTNAPIVAGTSGGPVLCGAKTVVGVAVTGADRMEDADTTENHGVVPIDALRFLVS